jgi:hypothetical protein
MSYLIHLSGGINDPGPFSSPQQTPPLGNEIFTLFNGHLTAKNRGLPHKFNKIPHFRRPTGIAHDATV